MSDTTIRTAERTLEADPTAWRPLLALYLRAGRVDDAAAMLEATEERIFASGRGLALAARNEAICGATVRPAMVALEANAREMLAISDARLRLDNDAALGRYGRVA